MKPRRLFATLLALTLMFGVFSATAADYVYIDLPEEHWAFQDMHQAVQIHVLWGIGDGQMDPDGALTWAQGLALTARTLAPEAFVDPANYDSDWKMLAYQACLAAGIVLPSEEEFLSVGPNTDQLNQPITRQDMAVLLDRALSKEVVGIAKDYDAAGTFADYAQLPRTHREAVERLFGLGILNGSVETDSSGEETRLLNGADTLRRCDGTALLMRTLTLVDRWRAGEARTVTIHVVDDQGQNLTDFTTDAAIGTMVAWLAQNELEDAEAFRYYTQGSCRNLASVSTASTEYTVTYRSMTEAEREWRDFSDAVQRGEADWADAWKLSYNRYELGENAYKRDLLFGDTAQRRYPDQATAAAGQATVTVPIWKLNRRGEKVASTASFSVNAALADDVTAIFTEIFNAPEQFPIKDLGGYSWRGDSSTSEHNCGTAIDINYMENYQVRDGNAMVGTHWTPGADPYSIPEEGSVVRIFEKYGWAWGGNAWAGHTDPAVGYHDYMHFSYMGG